MGVSFSVAMSALGTAGILPACGVSKRANDAWLKRGCRQDAGGPQSFTPPTLPSSGPGEWLCLAPERFLSEKPHTLFREHA